MISYVGLWSLLYLMFQVPILATANTQFGQEMALSCKPRMRSTDSIPIVSTSVCFLPLKIYTGITKILELEYKTDMIYWDIWLHFQNLSGFIRSKKLRFLALILFMSHIAFQYGPETNKSTISMCYSALYVDLAYLR